MISDGDLYQLAIFLGSVAMLLVVVYHFLEVNASDKTSSSSVFEEENHKGQVGSGAVEKDRAGEVSASAGPGTAS